MKKVRRSLEYNTASFAVPIFLSIALIGNVLAPVATVGQPVPDGETMNRVALNRLYLQQANDLFAQQFEAEKQLIEYENQRGNPTAEQGGNTTSGQENEELDKKIDQSKRKILEIQDALTDLEDLNKALFEVDPALTEKIVSITDKLRNKYMIDAPTENNPIQAIDENLLNRTVDIYIDPDKVASDKSNIPTEDNVDGIEIAKKFIKFYSLACSPNTNTGTCRPVIGGVSAAEKNTLSLNTIGYPAIDNGVKGFVIAAHTACFQCPGEDDGLNKVIVQPHSDSTKRVGIVTDFCNVNCGSPPHDHAFVKADTGIAVSNEIFIPPTSSTWQINKAMPKNSIVPGMFVAKSGAGSQFTTGQILSNTAVDVTAQVYGCPGDSGSPVFRGAGVRSAELLGMAYASNRNTCTQDQASDVLRFWAQETIATPIPGKWNGAVPITGGMVGNWGFDGHSGQSASDSSGFGNIGTLTNSPTWQDSTACRAGTSCLRFDGVNNFVSVADSSSLRGMAALTVSAWVKRSAISSNLEFVVTKGSVSGQGTFSYALWFDTDGKVSFAVSTSNGFNTIVSFEPLVQPLGSFHLLTGTYSSGNMKLYIDGVQVASATTPTGNVGSTTHPLTIAKRTHASSPLYFNGYVDDVRVYNRVLNVSEIESIYFNP